MMHVSIMHVRIMHISMTLDPDARVIMHISFIRDLGVYRMMRVCRMHVYMILDPDYVGYIYDS